MYISCQNRDGEILLKLEPLSSKKDIVSRLEVKLIDGSALTQTLDPKMYKGEQLKEVRKLSKM